MRSPSRPFALFVSGPVALVALVVSGLAAATDRGPSDGVPSPVVPRPVVPSLAGLAAGPSETSARVRPSPAMWPLAEPLVIRGFDPPAQPWSAGHRGVDLAGAVGQPVRAVAAGRVHFAGPVAGRPVVSVALAGTGRPPLRVTYEPVDAVVTTGQEVAAGQILGTLRSGPSHCGEAGAGERPCLHWGLRRGERYLDPLWLVRPHHPVLLPLSD
ncbi:M23 family metallopeptidase [Streptomyces alkaliterrae]|uniref:Peptidoglycan DD-metalloendopeptidase family protein n=1 Tax=Streptomyces alkaliterrae TaxID=2213162 RepID=A0A5P0YNM5_9ACTN|nr:M23 family metallopeptidase [Streptomyces alkaliterrae]MBB1257238.1 peptidoglycan DD-metalloendopeptidase family protein [Streptomyces alkaliterrae]MQS01953.1 peptidoglycan DD-metalloendopeptidase family protein [Streptomyces alkaliterrae]